jgi:hypothetical protein
MLPSDPYQVLIFHTPAYVAALNQIGDLKALSIMTKK